MQNAPLSREVCSLLGEAQGSKLKTDKGVRTELQRIADVVGNNIELPAEKETPFPGKTTKKLAKRTIFPSHCQTDELCWKLAGNQGMERDNN